MGGADETGTVDPNSGGLSRRDMIAKSVVAGGLVWAVPTLTSTPAGAVTGCPCDGGIRTTVKIPSSPSANCGVACLSQRESLNFPCLDDLVNCLFEQGFIEFQALNNGQVRKARIVLSGGITLLGAAVKSADDCFFADCENGYCPNTRSHANGSGSAEVVSPDRITVCANGSSGGNCGISQPGSPATPCTNTDPTKTEILFDTQGAPINHIELALCIPNALTGQCP